MSGLPAIYQRRLEALALQFIDTPVTSVAVPQLTQAVQKLQNDLFYEYP